MIFTNTFATFALFAGALALSRPTIGPVFPANMSCGEVNVFYTYAIHSRTLK
jgi:hypothetical protein